MPFSYRRAVAEAAWEAALLGTWIALRELPPARRMPARAGVLAVTGAVGYVVARRDGSASPPEPELVVGARPMLVSEGGPVVDPAAYPQPTWDKREAMRFATLTGFALATVAERRRLEKRWLARLIRDGRPHPTRALAIRMGAVEFTRKMVLLLARRRLTDR